MYVNDGLASVNYRYMACVLYNSNAGLLKAPIVAFKGSADVK